MTPLSTIIPQENNADTVHSYEDLSEDCGDDSKTDSKVDSNNHEKDHNFSGRINRKYILQPYGYSLILTGLASLFFYWEDIVEVSVPLLTGSFILYPFAKVLYDCLIGFKFDKKMKKQSFLSIYFYQLRFILYVLLYLFSVYIGPVGILYLFAKVIFRKKHP